MPLENRKRKKVFPFWERFNQPLSKSIPPEKKKEKEKLRRLLAEHKTSIFNPKFGKLLRRIWKIKSSASNLNLCPLNQLAKVTNSRG